MLAKLAVKSLELNEDFPVPWLFVTVFFVAWRGRSVPSGE